MDGAGAGYRPAGGLGRREFLAASAGTAAALAWPGRASAGAEARRLLMVSTHTGERLDVTYFEDGALVPQALAAVDRLLRDVRTGDVHPIDPAVLDVAWSVARAVDRPRGTFEIVCGYRSPRTNAALRAAGHGVAVKSLHLEGKAIDLRLRGVATSALRDAALALGRGGVGYYAAPDFVHLDTGRVRRW